MTLNLTAPVTSPRAESPQVQSAPAEAKLTQSQASSQRHSQQANLADSATLTTPQQQPSQAVLSYHVDQQSKQTYFQVVDQKTGDVIRQVPPKEMLNFERELSKMLKQEQAKA